MSQARNPVPGSLSIANEVIAELAGYAAYQSYGVAGMAAPSMQDGIAKILPMHRLRRGVLTEMTDKGAIIDMFVIIENGTNLAAVSQNLADSVRYVLEHYAQIKVLDVRIHVQGINQPR
ncbi:MAG: Asp23/Gls24 family envelope stress response protein [Coriobacteriia bacterium]|nr:Asp23/Gls24 family envelope stress response protein [Coriobacteriia bacterium]